MSGGGYYGKGVYVSELTDYSDSYRHTIDHDNYAMFICLVIKPDSKELENMVSLEEQTKMTKELITPYSTISALLLDKYKLNTYTCKKITANLAYVKGSPCIPRMYVLPDLYMVYPLYIVIYGLGTSSYESETMLYKPKFKPLYNQKKIVGGKTKLKRAKRKGGSPESNEAMMTLISKVLANIKDYKQAIDFDYANQIQGFTLDDTQNSPDNFIMKFKGNIVKDNVNLLHVNVTTVNGTFVNYIFTFQIGDEINCISVDVDKNKSDKEQIEIVTSLTSDLNTPEKIDTASLTQMLANKIETTFKESGHIFDIIPPKRPLLQRVVPSRPPPSLPPAVTATGSISQKIYPDEQSTPIKPNEFGTDNGGFVLKPPGYMGGKLNLVKPVNTGTKHGRNTIWADAEGLFIVKKGVNQYLERFSRKKKNKR